MEDIRKSNNINELINNSCSTDRLFLIFVITALLLTGWSPAALGQTVSVSDLPYSSTTVLPSAQAADWLARYEKLSAGIKGEQLNQQDADRFYQELSVALTETRNRIREALIALETPVVQLTKPAPALDADEGKTASSPGQTAENREHVFHEAGQLRVDLIVLYNLRIHTMELISKDLR